MLNALTPKHRYEMSHWLAACLLIGGLLTVTTATAEDLPVDLELVLAVDVSASIDAEEARQQREGYVAAIADPAVIEAIRANFHQRIALAYVEWASADYQRLLIDWTVIEDAGECRRVRRGACRGTGVFGALDLDQWRDRLRRPAVRRQRLRRRDGR